MESLPSAFVSKRASLEFDEIEYGVGGISLLQLSDLASGQIGYSTTPDGKPLTGQAPGDWKADWIVFGNETACGDPLFLSTRAPYRVFTAMHGEDRWNATLVAPSLESFWRCLEVFRRVAQGRASPVELEAHPLSEEEVAGYHQAIEELCAGDEDAIGFWLVQAEIGIEDDEGSLA